MWAAMGNKESTLPGLTLAAAHVAADLQCWYTVKPIKKNKEE